MTPTLDDYSAIAHSGEIYILVRRKDVGKKNPLAILYNADTGRVGEAKPLQVLFKWGQFEDSDRSLPELLESAMQEGGPGSGNWRHKGRKGQVGGSQPGGGKVAPSGGASESPRVPAPQDKQLGSEDYLLDAIRSGTTSELAVGGEHAFAVQIVEYANGEKAIVKPSGKALDDPYDDPAFYNEAEAEVAAYELSKLVGLDMVPATVLEGKPGAGAKSVQHFAEGMWDGKQQIMQTDKAPKLSPLDNAKVGIFDALIGNEDRHNGNIMVPTDGSNSRVVLIDHGLAFKGRNWENYPNTSRGRAQTWGEKSQWEWDESEVKKLRSYAQRYIDLKPADMRKVLEPLGMGNRVDTLVKHLEAIQTGFIMSGLMN